MTVQKKILVSGGGIAGPACAFWLHRHGYEVVIAEKAPMLREGGQNVDIKGAGQQVIRMMGLTAAIEARDTLECGQKYISASGEVVAVLPKGAAGTLTSEFEILRGDFAQVLYDATRDGGEWRFGRSIDRLAETDDGVTVTFDNGDVEQFALVVCAEGMGSSTRAVVFGEETKLRYLGAYMAFFKVPRLPADDRWAHTVNGVGGTMITLRPGNETDTTVLVTFLRSQTDADTSPSRDRKAMLFQALEGRGTIADRIIAALDAVEDFYFGPMSQVQVSTWSKGRVVLLGDAGFCPTPFTGEGTALALVGAYVLAGELKRGADHAQAFAAYEARIRPCAEASQNRLNPRLIRLVHPRTWIGIGLTRLVQRVASAPWLQERMRPGTTGRERANARDFALPDYG